MPELPAFPPGSASSGTGAGVADYAPGIAYAAGQVVKRNGELLRALVAIPGAWPFHPARWEALGRQARGWLGTGLLPISNRHGRWDLNSTAGAALSNGTNTDHNSRIAHTLIADADHVYPLFHLPNVAPAVAGDPVTINAALEYAAAGYQDVLFAGQLSAVMRYGGVLLADPVPAAMRAGEQCWMKVHAVVAAAGKWPYTHNSAEAGELAADAAAASDLTKGTIVGNGNALSAFALLYRPAGRVVPITVTGDSIMGCWTCTVSSNLVRRALGATKPINQAVMYGEGATSFQSRNRRDRRLASHAGAGCGFVFDNFGVNEIRGPQTAAATMPQLLAHWDRLAAEGHRVLNLTTTPTGCTGTFTTVVGQTVTSPTNNSEKNLLNAWRRDGAPIDQSTRAPQWPVTGAVYRAGEGTHPLTTTPGHPKGLVDVNQYIENDPINGDGKFAVGSGAVTVDGLHWNDNGHVLAAAAIAAPDFA